MGDDAVLGRALDLERLPEARERVGDVRRGLALLVAQLGVAVQVAPPADDVLEHGFDAVHDVVGRSVRHGWNAYPAWRAGTPAGSAQAIVMNGAGSVSAPREVRSGSRVASYPSRLASAPRPPMSASCTPCGSHGRYENGSSSSLSVSADCSGFAIRPPGSTLPRWARANIVSKNRSTPSTSCGLGGSGRIVWRTCRTASPALAGWMWSA